MLNIKFMGEMFECIKLFKQEIGGWMYQMLKLLIKYVMKIIFKQQIKEIFF